MFEILGSKEPSQVLEVGGFDGNATDVGDKGEWNVSDRFSGLDLGALCSPFLLIITSVERYV